MALSLWQERKRSEAAKLRLTNLAMRMRLKKVKPKTDVDLTDEMAHVARLAKARPPVISHNIP